MNVDDFGVCFDHVVMLPQKILEIKYGLSETVSEAAI